MTEGTPSPAEEIATLALRHGLRVAVAESLTSGRVAAELGAAQDASDWFCGGVVAYAEHVKFEVLGVTPGPVVTERCAIEMATGVARSLRAEVTVALTGVGGPDPTEGEPPGTVYLATAVHGDVDCRRLQLDGDPGQVVAAAAEAAQRALVDRLQERFEQVG